LNFNKALSLILSFALLICSLPTIYNTVKAETVLNGYIFESNVNIREKASTSSKSLGKVSYLNVTVLSKQNDEDNKINPATNKVFVWYKVTYTDATATVTGFIREDLITVSEYTTDPDFDKQLLNFPESYRDALKKLHAIYPNWKFVPNTVPLSFSESVNAQDNLFRKLVKTDSKSWLSMRKGCYDWSSGKFIETDTGGWYGASREVIAYYMDPRNFLNANDVYLFMTQSYDSANQTIGPLENIIEKSFLNAVINDVNDQNYGKRYSEVILQAAKESKVNPYVLAATIIQEQGWNGAELGKGTTYKDKTVYNFFNFGAGGNTSAEVLKNGKKFAYEQGWFTPSEALIKGAVRYANNYIKSGQDTYYYKNFNVLNPNKLWHQYAQNVADSINSSSFLRSACADKYNLNLTFRIPVFKSLPSKVSKLPAKSDKLNNYYFDSIESEGLTPTFNRYNFEYSLSVKGNAIVILKSSKGAKYIGETDFKLKKGENAVKLKIKSATGYTNTYTINVFAEMPATLSLMINDDTVTEKQVMRGDTNGDNKINLNDLTNIKLHLLGKITLKSDNLKGADTNKDNKITTTDLANVKLHLLGKFILK
jgi:beta-N-acetylglucosaminidase